MPMYVHFLMFHSFIYGLILIPAKALQWKNPQSQNISNVTRIFGMRIKAKNLVKII